MELSSPVLSSPLLSSPLLLLYPQICSDFSFGFAQAVLLDSLRLHPWIRSNFDFGFAQAVRLDSLRMYPWIRSDFDSGFAQVYVSIRSGFHFGFAQALPTCPARPKSHKELRKQNIFRCGEAHAPSGSHFS